MFRDLFLMLLAGSLYYFYKNSPDVTISSNKHTGDFTYSITRAPPPQAAINQTIIVHTHNHIKEFTDNHQHHTSTHTHTHTNTNTKRSMNFGFKTLDIEMLPGQGQDALSSVAGTLSGMYHNVIDKIMNKEAKPLAIDTAKPQPGQDVRKGIHDAVVDTKSTGEEVDADDDVIADQVTKDLGGL